MKLFSAFIALFAVGAAEDSCTIADYSNTRVNSWRTNCPSGCEIYQYLGQVDDKLNDDWNKLEKKLTEAGDRMGGVDNLHVTLDEILKKIKEALRTIKKEKDLFEEMKRIYRGADMNNLINNQRLKLAELTTKKSKLQIELSNKQKKFKEEAGFCKVSFMQYDEEVCDILNYAKEY
jgi:paraquat-inducible protein B